MSKIKKISPEEFKEKLLAGEILPDNLTVEGSLNLCNCTSLTSLPDNLTVEGSLYLHNCTSLTSLPDNLTVEGSLDLHNCTSLTSLPDNIEVGGFLYFGGNPFLIKKLPNGLKKNNLYWNTVRATEQIIFYPETLTKEDILNEENIEVRTIMIERIGKERLKELMGFREVNKGIFNNLKYVIYKTEEIIDDDFPIYFLEVTDPSKKNTKPLLRIPPPQRINENLTDENYDVRKALAWIFYKEENEYYPLVET